MEKYIKRLKKRMERLWQNVKSGNVADIILLSSGGILVVVLLVVFMVSIFTHAPQEELLSDVLSQDSTAKSVVESVENSASANSTSSQSSSANAAQSSSKTTTSATSSISSSSDSVASSSTAETTTTTTSTASSTSQSTSTAHVHTYGEWERECALCEAGTQVRYCTGCTVDTDGYAQREAVSATTNHIWVFKQFVTNEETGVTGEMSECSVCGATWTVYP